MSLVFPYLYFHSEFHNVPDYNDSCKSLVGNQEYSHRCFYKVLGDIDSKVPREKKVRFKILISWIFKFEEFVLNGLGSFF